VWRRIGREKGIRFHHQSVTTTQIAQFDEAENKKQRASSSLGFLRGLMKNDKGNRLKCMLY
jgi:hypothetical protein